MERIEEEWSKSKKKVSTLHETDNKSMYSSDREEEDQALMEDLESLDTEGWK